MRAIDLAIILIQYVIRVDSTDLSGFDVEIHLKDAPTSFEIAMNAHPEYDDRYWRYLRNMRIEGTRPGATVVRSDSAIWRVTLPGGRVVPAGGESVHRSGAGQTGPHVGQRPQRSQDDAQAMVFGRWRRMETRPLPGSTS